MKTFSFLKAKASIAGDLYREGRVTRSECFRVEMDAILGIDSGPLVLRINDDHSYMIKNSPEYQEKMSVINK